MLLLYSVACILSAGLQGYRIDKRGLGHGDDSGETVGVEPV